MESAVVAAAADMEATISILLATQEALLRSAAVARLLKNEALATEFEVQAGRARRLAGTLKPPNSPS
jgi:hypothetical protein